MSRFSKVKGMKKETTPTTTFHTMFAHQPMIVVDPGANGGVVIQHKDGSLECYATPDIDIVPDWLRQFDDSDYWFVIEKQHAVQGNGLVSTWTFAANYSTWVASAKCYNLVVISILAQNWMRRLHFLPKGLIKPKRKNIIKEFSKEQFPQFKVTLKNSDALAFFWVFNKYYLKK